MTTIWIEQTEEGIIHAIRASDDDVIVNIVKVGGAPTLCPLTPTWRETWEGGYWEWSF